MKKLLRTLIILFILGCLLTVGGIMLLGLLVSSSQPETPEEIARAVTDDEGAAVTISDGNLTVLFTFQNTLTARQDALRIFPTLLCDFREKGYTTHTYRIIGAAILDGSILPGISTTLTPEEVAAYPCGQVGQIELEISPDLP